MSDAVSDAEPVVLPAATPAPRKGERAAQIRQLALRHPELSRSDIARKVGCDPANVTGVLKTFLKTKTSEELESFRSNKVDILEAVQFRVLSSITDEKLAKESAYSNVVAASILQDKIQLMSGLPTSIHVTALVDVLSALRDRDDG